MKHIMLYGAIAPMLASASRLLPIAYDPGKGGWKLDPVTNAPVMNNGNPVFINADGTEGVIDMSTISRLNAEAKQNRERAEKAEAIAKAFEGVDPAAAKKALETVKNIDQKRLIDAGEVEKVRKEIEAGYATQMTELKTANQTLEQQLHSTIKDNAFATSAFIKEKIAVPADLIKSTFANNFKYEEGKLVPYDTNGQKIFSKKRLGEIADFDEGFETLINGYAHKDSILKGTNNGGSGNNGNGGNGNGGMKTLNRAQFATLTPGEQAQHAKLVQEGKGAIVD